jgi:hypothetical protein
MPPEDVDPVDAGPTMPFGNADTTPVDEVSPAAAEEAELSEPNPTLPTRTPPARSAIIYLPGLGSDHTADRAFGIARRIERAFSRSRSVPSGATYTTTMSEVAVQNRLVSVSAIERFSAGNETPDARVDVYHLNYRRILREDFERASVLERIYRLLIATLWASWKVIRHPLKRDDRGLGWKDRLQIAYAVLVLLVLFIYLGVLLVAAYTSISELYDSEVTELTGQESRGMPDIPAINWPTTPDVQWPESPKWFDDLRNQFTDPTGDFHGFWAWLTYVLDWLRDFIVALVSWLWVYVVAALSLGVRWLGWFGEFFSGPLSQTIVVLSVLLTILIPKAGKLRERVGDAAVDFLVWIDYMNVGDKRKAVLGHLYELIGYVAAQNPDDDADHPEIHIVAYSFGSIVALDALVPFANPPADPLRHVKSLTTIATPVDLVRTYWPGYFEQRERAVSLPENWYNVFCPLDVLSSQFGPDLAGFPGPAARAIGLYIPKKPSKSSGIVGKVKDFMTPGK